MYGFTLLLAAYEPDVVLSLDNGEYLILQPIELGLRETSTRNVDD